jgi:hypothetical protein
VGCRSVKQIIIGDRHRHQLVECGDSETTQSRSDPAGWKGGWRRGGESYLDERFSCWGRRRKAHFPKGGKLQCKKYRFLEDHGPLQPTHENTHTTPLDAMEEAEKVLAIFTVTCLLTISTWERVGLFSSCRQGTERATTSNNRS